MSLSVLYSLQLTGLNQGDLIASALEALQVDLEVVLSGGLHPSTLLVVELLQEGERVGMGVGALRPVGGRRAHFALKVTFAQHPRRCVAGVLNRLLDIALFVKAILIILYHLQGVIVLVFLDVVAAAVEAI